MQASESALQNRDEGPQKADSKFGPWQTIEGKCREKAEKRRLGSAGPSESVVLRKPTGHPRFGHNPNFPGYQTLSFVLNKFGA
jgi:hypothetical protein